MSSKRRRFGRFAVYDVAGSYLDLIEDARNLFTCSFLSTIKKLRALKAIYNHGVLCIGEVSLSPKHRLKEPVALFGEIRRNQKATI